MADQQTPNNPNSGTIGISSFGGTPPSNNPVPSPTPSPVVPSVPQPTPFPAPSTPVTPPVPMPPVTPAPAAIPTPPVAPTPVATPSPAPAPSAPVTPVPQPSAAVAPSTPVTPPPSKAVEPTPTSNLTNQTFMGGIDNPKEESKNKFSLPSFHAEKDKPAVTTPQTPMQSTPTYNEVTASGSKNKFALIAIIIGVLLLLVAGGGYYYLTFMNKPAEVAEPEPVVEEVVEDVPQQSVIDTDPYIMQISQMEATASPEPVALRNQIQSLEFGQIDAEVQIDTGTPPAPTTPINEPAEPSAP